MNLFQNLSIGLFIHSAVMLGIGSFKKELSPFVAGFINLTFALILAVMGATIK